MKTDCSCGLPGIVHAAPTRKAAGSNPVGRTKKKTPANGDIKPLAGFFFSNSGLPFGDKKRLRQRITNKYASQMQVKKAPTIRDCRTVGALSYHSVSSPVAVSTFSLAAARIFTRNSGTGAPMAAAFSRMLPSSVRMYHTSTIGSSSTV